MSLNTAQLEYLASKGMSLADAIELSHLGDIRKDPTAAQRQQRRRDNIKAARDSSHRDVTRDAPNDIYSNPQSLTPDDDKSSSTPKPKRPREKSGLASMPDGWEPVLTPAAQQIVDGWPPGWLEARLAEFTDHASDKGRKSKDWQAAFRQWLIKADTWGKQKNGNDRQGSANPNRGRDGFINALRDVADRQAPDPHAGKH